MDRIDALLKRGEPAAPALIDRSATLGYAELDQLVDRLAADLGRRIAPADRVALWLPKSWQAVALMFAVSRAGGVLVPVNPVLRAPQVAHILSDSGARLLITHTGRAAMLGEGGPSAPPVLTLENDWEALAREPAGAPPAVPASELAALLYTSGSTGQPKGVMVTHANMLVGAASVAAYLGTGPNDRVLSVLPLSFDFGFSQLTTAFHAGASAILLDYLTPRDVVQAAARHQATQLAAVPPLWIQLAGLEWPAEAVASLRTLSNSGGRLPTPVVHGLRRLFPAASLHLMYGLTEAFRSTTLPPELADTHPDSIGRAIPDAEILIVRPDESPTADNEPGELVHCGPLVTKGYWGDPARTAERFRPAPEHSRYGGVAVWSGDTVVRDAEGLLAFVGRSDETIKTMGTRVSPTEIEEIAYRSGAVAACVALGVEDAATGQKICLVAAPANGLSPAGAEAQMLAAFRHQAAPYMQPADIVWLETLPVSANGKLDRAALRAQYEPDGAALRARYGQ